MNEAQKLPFFDSIHAKCPLVPDQTCDLDSINDELNTCKAVLNAAQNVTECLSEEPCPTYEPCPSCPPNIECPSVETSQPETEPAKEE